MRHTREILRHKWLLGSSHRLVTSSLAVSHGAITDTTQRALRAGLCWDSVCALADSELELLMYPPPPSAGTLRPEPDFVTIDLELRRKGVTLELLHQEYLALHPEGYRRSSFCAHYETWKKTRGLTMRQVHQGGDRLFVDYSGLKAYYTDPITGDSVACELFVAALGASSYTYAEASRSQQVPDFLASHVRALAFFGGVPAAVVSDQLRSGVSRPCRYDLLFWAIPSPRWTPKTLHFFLIGVSALVFRCFQPDLFWIEALREPPPFDQGFRDQGTGIPKALLIMKSGDPTYLVLAQRNPTT